jgi:hypothetical protein
MIVTSSWPACRHLLDCNVLKIIALYLHRKSINHDVIGLDDEVPVTVTTIIAVFPSTMGRFGLAQ